VQDDGATVEPGHRYSLTVLAQHQTSTTVLPTTCVTSTFLCRGSSQAGPAFFGPCTSLRGRKESYLQESWPREVTVLYSSTTSEPSFIRPVTLYSPGLPSCTFSTCPAFTQPLSLGLDSAYTLRTGHRIHIRNPICRQYTLEVVKLLAPSAGWWPVQFQMYSTIRKLALAMVMRLIHRKQVSFYCFTVAVRVSRVQSG